MTAPCITDYALPVGSPVDPRVLSAIADALLAKADSLSADAQEPTVSADATHLLTLADLGLMSQRARLRRSSDPDLLDPFDAMDTADPCLGIYVPALFEPPRRRL